MKKAETIVHHYIVLNHMYDTDPVNIVQQINNGKMTKWLYKRPGTTNDK